LEQLSGLDAGFLYLETAQTPMHVGSLHLYELPAGYRGNFCADVRAHVARRMHLAPVFTRKLASMPLDLASPVWTGDDAVDLDYHVRRIVLPRPGSVAQLETAAGRLHSILMDRARPLWEFYVFEGLQDGRIGFYAKVHHAAVDGQAGVALANAILDLSPLPREVAPPPHAHGAAHPPGAAALVATALSNQLLQYVKWARLLPEVAKMAAWAGVQALAARRGHGAQAPPASARNWRIGPRTPFNVAISGERVFASAAIPLAEIRALGQAFEASVNDVVLAVCSGALRRYLQRAGGVPEQPLIAAVPVSLRQQGDASLNNQATMTLVNLATHLADPGARVAAIRAGAAAMKAQMGRLKGVMPTDYPSIGVPWLLKGLAALYRRSGVANRVTPLANVAISNVPGPQVPLYLAGAKMLTYAPLSIVTHGLALNITVESYNGTLFFGLVACPQAVPRLRALTRDILASHAQLRQLAASVAPVGGEKGGRKTGAVKKAAGQSKPVKTAARKAKPVGTAAGKHRPSKEVGRGSTPARTMAAKSGSSGNLAGKAAGKTSKQVAKNIAKAAVRKGDKAAVRKPIAKPVGRVRTKASKAVTPAKPAAPRLAAPPRRARARRAAARA
jgi:WS/DGAT/MGAT family acyltransferase